MFQLTKEEADSLELHIIDNPHSLRFQIETSSRRGGVRYLPYAFTEQVDCQYECKQLEVKLQTRMRQSNSIAVESFTDNKNHFLRSQNVTLENGRGKYSKYLPYAFTEQGVAMLSGILKSEKAINMNITIMRAFVEMRKIMLSKEDVWEQLLQLKQRIGEHDTQLSAIYDAIENLLDDKVAEKKWAERERIGFKK